jgi:pimeloyl-ACP methyl ester carboxylesterase
MNLLFLRTQRRRLVGMVVLTLVVAFLAIPALSRTASAATAAPTIDPIVGDWSAKYRETQAVVTMSRSGGSYTETAKSPFQLSGSSCILPPGTILATFSGSGNMYSGQHGLWHTGDCSFGIWTSLSLTLSGSTLTGVLGGGFGTVIFTKVGSPPPFAHVRPIIFVPGVTGSYLADETGTEVWPNIKGMTDCVSAIHGNMQDLCDFKTYLPMALKADGSSPALSGPKGRIDVANGVYRPAIYNHGHENLYGVLDFIHGSAYGSAHYHDGTNHVYDITAQNLQNSGYSLAMSDAELGKCAITLKCWIPAAVDWRKSSAFNASRLLQLIDQVIQLTHTDRVNILAHSQGGLITNALLHMPASMGKIYRVVTLGTPYLGAPKLLAELLFKKPCQFKATICLFSEVVLQFLIKNYPGAMELMPSPAYYKATVYSPLVKLKERDIHLSYKEARSFIQSQLASLGRDMTLANAAAAWHNSVDDWNANPPIDPQIQLIRAIGYDSKDGGSCDHAPCNQYYQIGDYNGGKSGGGTITAIDEKTGDLHEDTGDGTVPLNSANVYDPGTGFDGRGGQHDLYFCAVSHLGLAQAQVTWGAAQPFLEGSRDYTQDAIGQHCPGGGDGTLQGVPLN